MPDRTGTAPPGLKYGPFGDPSAVRRLALVSRPRSPRERLIEALHAALLAARPPAPTAAGG